MAQLFLGVISKIKAGKHKAKTVPRRCRCPAAVEVTPTGLLATINALPTGPKPKGQVVTITP